MTKVLEVTLSSIELSQILSHRSLFWLSVSLSRCHLLFCFLDGKMVDFGDCSRTVLAFYVPGNDADDVASWKMDIPLWNTKKASLFVIFGTLWWFCTIEHYKDHFQSWKSTVLLIFTCSIQWRKALHVFVLKFHCPLSSSSSSKFKIILARGPTPNTHRDQNLNVSNSVLHQYGRLFGCSLKGVWG
jgi:hypothetical protein